MNKYYTKTSNMFSNDVRLKKIKNIIFFTVYMYVPKVEHWTLLTIHMREKEKRRNKQYEEAYLTQNIFFFNIPIYN